MSFFGGTQQQQQHTGGCGDCGIVTTNQLSFQDSYGLYSNILKNEMIFFKRRDLLLNRPLQELNKVKSAFQCSCVEAGVPFVFVLSIETNNGICDSFIVVTSVCNGKTYPIWKTPLEKDGDRLSEKIQISKQMGWCDIDNK